MTTTSQSWGPREEEAVAPTLSVAKTMSSRTPSLAVPAGGCRLDSWKEIALYVRREVRTVQRWEKRERMPVHRHIHPNGSTVYAFREEIDAWLMGRRKAPPPGSSPNSERRRETGPKVTVTQWAQPAPKVWFAILDIRKPIVDTSLSDPNPEGLERALWLNVFWS